MELAEGEDLADRLKRGPIPVDEALAIARQIADALEDAHEQGVVHRDLKPGNVKLTPDGKVKVLDFGLAKAWTEPAARRVRQRALSQSPTLAHAGTAAGLILGTAAYMSPEQARGRTVDRRADIWAFGVVLFEMLAGRKLFGGDTVSGRAGLGRERDPATGRRFPPGHRRRCERLLERCLERDPGSACATSARRASALERRPSRASRPEDGGSDGARQRFLAAIVPWLLRQRGRRRRGAPRRGEKAGCRGQVGDGALRLRGERRAATGWPSCRPDAATWLSTRRYSPQNGIHVRPLREPGDEALPQTDGRAAFFWSPDGRQLAAASEGRLWRWTCGRASRGRSSSCRTRPCAAEPGAATASSCVSIGARCTA